MKILVPFLALLVVASCDTASSSATESQDSPRLGGTLPSSPRSSGIASSRKTAITEAVSRVAPAVVTVQTETVQRVAADPFEQMYGGQSGQRVTPGLGSGFIVRQDGVIVTNAHVVAGSTKLSVALRDGTTYPATVIGVDEANDLAVIRIEARGLPVAPLGNSDELLIGEWAIAIGNPYGFLLGNSEPSVTAGVISGTGRNLVAASEGGGMYVDMVQTDAAINPGNSGGPLINATGEVIGVNSSIYSPSGGSVGLGFAIPINRARRVADDLLAHGAVRRPWVGVKLQLPNSANPRDAITSGAVVRSVVPGSPAARGGLRPGDLIVSAGGRRLHNPFDWAAELLDLRVGQQVSLRITRGTAESDVTVTVADLPEVSAAKVQVLKELELVTLTPAIRAQNGVRSSSGALIYRVSDRVAEDLGFQTGDVIVQVNRTPITTANEAAQAITYYGGRGPIRAFFEHAGRVYTTDFQLQ
ncbi:MAG: serine protease Do [Pseudonocardiales bacterium]|nr:serine protease Do [Pseudonocardiales bacterium]